MKRYDRYFLMTFLQSLVLILALVTTVFLVVDVLLNLDRIEEFPDVARGSLLYYSFNLPPILYLLYPLLIAAAGLFALARVLRGRELLILETAGVGKRRALAAIMIPALLLGGVGLMLREAALPQLAEARRGSPYGAYEYRKGKRITVRDDEGAVWFVRRYDLGEQKLSDVRILEHGGKRLLVADELRWEEEKERWWSPRTMTIYDILALSGEAKAEAATSVAAGGELPFGRLLPEDFSRRRRGHDGKALSELWREGAITPADRALKSTLWHEIWHPLSGFILLLCGAGLILSPTSRSAFVSGSLTIVCIVGYQIGSFWFETLATAGAMPPVIGAAVTPVCFGLFGWLMFRRG